jgi:hypothetical protein
LQISSNSSGGFGGFGIEWSPYFSAHRRGAEIAEIKFFSFVAETPTNENAQPLRGSITIQK